MLTGGTDATSEHQVELNGVGQLVASAGIAKIMGLESEPSAHQRHFTAKHGCLPG